MNFEFWPFLLTVVTAAAAAWGGSKFVHSDASMGDLLAGVAGLIGGILVWVVMWPEPHVTAGGDTLTGLTDGISTLTQGVVHLALLAWGAVAGYRLAQHF